MKKTEKNSKIICACRGENTFADLFRSDVCKYKGKEVTVLQVMSGGDNQTYMVEIVENQLSDDGAHVVCPYPKQSKSVEQQKRGE